MPQSRTSKSKTSASSRRSFLTAAAAGGLGGLATLTGCTSQSAGAGKENRLRALCGNAGLKTSWCSLGKKCMDLWGEMLNVEIVWVDGELESDIQANKVGQRAGEDWDFACIQANKSGTLVDALKPLTERNIPLLTMDVTLTENEDEMRNAGVWTHVSGDQEFMGATSARAMIEKIGGRGRVIHIGGVAGHSGAQGRKRGFEKVHADFPEIEVVGGLRWADWVKDKALDTFSAILNQNTDQKIDGCFCHNDDMALACATALPGTIHEGMVITGIDGQADGLNGVEDGTLYATTINPVSLIHMTALALGQFMVRNGETIDEVPEKVVTPGPLVSQDTGNLEAMRYMADPRHCMV